MHNTVIPLGNSGSHVKHTHLTVISYKCRGSWGIDTLAPVSHLLGMTPRGMLIPWCFSCHASRKMGSGSKEDPFGKEMQMLAVGREADMNRKDKGDEIWVWR